ncbi:DMT family transporter [Mesobacillus jeotgali]|uniref:DMT family transporter n=1 Tax=Mesobacillus jeotgali TaxID=129985 RepID=UPI0009A6D60E|nr:DMT family transporter [Mesobacillus jeotgali]
MFLGLLFALIAGCLVGLQNIFNSKVNEKAGSWVTTAIVLGIGFLASFFLGFLFEGKELFNLTNIQWWHWFSGLLGIGVVTGIVQAIKFLGPTFAISIVLTSQLGFAVLWDSLGWLGLEKVPLTEKQLLGVLIIIAGVIVFKWSEGAGAEKAPVSRNKKAEVL